MAAGTGQEIQIQSNLTIRKVSADGQRLLLSHQHNRAFYSVMNGANGPTPGAVLVPLAGVDISLSQLTIPGWLWLEHLGRADGVDVGADPAIYYVELGIKDILTGRFVPFPELWPGDAYSMRLSRNLLEEYNQTGTGTGPANNILHAISHVAPCRIFVGAYER